MLCGTLNHAGGRTSFDEIDQFDSSSPTQYLFGSDDAIDGLIIGPFGKNIRSDRQNQFQGGIFVEDDDTIDAGLSGQDAGSIMFSLNGS